MKYLIACLLFAPLILSADQKFSSIQRLFKETFPKAKEIKWYDEKPWKTVHFKNDNIKTVLKYNARAEVVETRRYYKEDRLPPFITASVKHSYPDKTIYGITEVFRSDCMFYRIVLEDDDQWIHLDVDPNALMGVSKRMNK